MKTRLQEIRRAAGYKSANDFAEAHGLNSGTYTAHEQGKRELSLSKTWEYSQILHCSVSDFIPREKDSRMAHVADDFNKAVGIAREQVSEIQALYDSMDDAARFALITVARSLAITSPKSVPEA